MRLRYICLFMALLLLTGCVNTPPSAETPPAVPPPQVETESAPEFPPEVMPLAPTMAGYSFTSLPWLSAWAADGTVDILDARDGRLLVGVSVRFADARGGLEQGYNCYTGRLAVADAETGAVVQELTPPRELLCTAGLLTDDGTLLLAEGSDGYQLYEDRNGKTTLLDEGTRGFSWSGAPKIIPLGGGFAAFPFCDLENETLGVRIVTPAREVRAGLTLSGTDGASLYGNGTQYALVTAQDGTPTVFIGDRTGELHSFALREPLTRVWVACLFEDAVLLTLATEDEGRAEQLVYELTMLDFDGNEVMKRVAAADAAPLLFLETDGVRVALGTAGGRPYFIEALRDELWIASVDLGVNDVLFRHLDGERFLVQERGGKGRFFLLDLAGGAGNQDAGHRAYNHMLDAFGGERPDTENFAGAFLDDRGRLVVRMTDEAGVREMRELLRGHSAVVERAEYSLKTLKEIGEAYLQEMDIPHYGHGVDEVENAYVIEVDAAYAAEIAAAEARRAQTGFPVILRPGEPLSTFPFILEGTLGAEDGPVTLRLTDGSVTPTGADFVLENHSDQSYMYGEAYSLHRKTAAGEWEGVEITAKEFWYFLAIGYTLPPGESRVIAKDWEWLCGELPPGSYRFVTGVIPEDGSGEDEVVLYADFEID